MVLHRAIYPAISWLIAIATAVAFLAVAPLISGAMSPAQAQTSVSVEFRTALEPHGKWHRHDRWGEVWVPARRERDWRPYTVGQWVYTDDWGWYWRAADAEADWGWVTYHYGRWVLVDDLGWAWVPGNEWGPGWVSWRRGGEHVGWAPLPPDRVIVEYRDKPDVWIFVRSRDFVAPVIARVIVPVREYRVIVRQTVIVNRTVVIRDRRIAVNPGIAPAIIAASVGRPIRAFEIRPVVIAGTARIPNAVEVRAADLREGRRDRVRVTVRETQETIQPAKEVPKPQPLAENEQGRLGDNPPRAARQAERKPGEPLKDEAAERRRGEPSKKDEAAERKPGEPLKDEAAERRRGEPSKKDEAAGRKPGEPLKDEAAEQRKGEPSKGRAAEQKGGRSQDDAADQKKGEQPTGQAREQRREQRQSQPQGAQEQRQRPGATRTEGRSPPASSESDRGSPATRDKAPRGATPTERPRSEAPGQRGSGAAPNRGRGKDKSGNDKD